MSEEEGDIYIYIYIYIYIERERERERERGERQTDRQMRWNQWMRDLKKAVLEALETSKLERHQTKMENKEPMKRQYI